MALKVHRQLGHCLSVLKNLYDGVVCLELLAGQGLNPPKAHL
jgi:hypothetical protein